MMDPNIQTSVSMGPGVQPNVEVKKNHFWIWLTVVVLGSVLVVLAVWIFYAVKKPAVVLNPSDSRVTMGEGVYDKEATENTGLVIPRSDVEEQKEILKGLLPVEGEGFSVTWNENKQVAEATIDRTNKEGFKNYNSWRANNGLIKFNPTLFSVE